MTYAQGRTFYDADSHIMELPDFLDALRGSRHARAPARDPAAARRPLANSSTSGSQPQAHATGARRELLALGDGLITRAEGLHGARRLQRATSARRRSICSASRGSSCSRRSPKASRSRSSARSTSATRPRAPTTARWRSSARKDPRLMGVALLPLDDPQARSPSWSTFCRLGL